MLSPQLAEGTPTATSSSHELHDAESCAAADALGEECNGGPAGDEAGAAPHPDESDAAGAACAPRPSAVTPATRPAGAPDASTDAEDVGPESADDDAPLWIQRAEASLQKQRDDASARSTPPAKRFIDKAVATDAPPGTVAQLQQALRRSQQVLLGAHAELKLLEAQFAAERPPGAAEGYAAPGVTALSGDGLFYADHDEAPPSSVQAHRASVRRVEELRRTRR